MPVQLKDAEIKVKLDLGDAEKVGTVEEKTKRQRKEDERERERRKDRERREGGTKGGRRGGGIGRYIGVGALAAGFKSLIRAGTSLPFGMGVPFGIAIAGMGAAELNERFGPMMKGIVEASLPDVIQKVPGASDALTGLMDMSAEMAVWWPAMKAKLTSIGEAFSQTKAIAGAITITGGDITPELVSEIFGEARAASIHRILLEKSKQRLRMELIGGALGKAVVGASHGDMEKKLEAGINR